MYYKLTDQNLRTHNGFQWELNKWYEIPAEKQGGELCSNSWFHCYNHPWLAALLNPIHANIDNPRLFEIETDGDAIEDNGLKFGFTKMRLVKEIEVPKITLEQRVRFAILCALEVYREENFVEWAQKWLDGSNRSASAANEAAAEAAWVARDAAWVAWAAAWAAWDAARVARAAAEAAAEAAWVARDAAWVARAAAWVAWDAARVARAAAEAAEAAEAASDTTIDLISLATQAQAMID